MSSSLMKFSTEAIWIVLCFAAYVLSRINLSGSVHLDRLLASPLLPAAGILLSFWAFHQAPANFQSWGPLARFAGVNVVGLAVILFALSVGFKNHGPGALGIVAIFMVYAFVGLALIAALSLKLAYQVGSTASPGASMNAVKVAAIVAGCLFVAVGGLWGLVTFFNSRPIGKGQAVIEKERFESTHESKRITIVPMSPDAWRLSISTFEPHRFGLKAGTSAPGDFNSISTVYAARILAEERNRKLLRLPGHDWSATLAEDGKLLIFSGTVDLPRLNSNDLTEDLDSLARGEVIPWIWINHLLMKLPSDPIAAEQLIWQRFAQLEELKSDSSSLKQSVAATEQLLKTTFR
jgi:hypothetical protein